MFEILLINLGILWTCMILMWLAAIKLEDVSIVDRFWGVMCITPAVTTWLQLGEPSQIGKLAVLCVTLWGLRVAWHITQRNWGHGEDPRYTSFLAKHRPGWTAHWYSLRYVFLLQGFLAWLISSPVQLVQFAEPHHGFAWLAVLGIAVWLTGFLTEVIGDAQLKRFKRDPDNKGKLMDRGLWSWTRHPNYFGDFTVWVGLAIVAASVPWGWLTFISPAVFLYFLLKITGVVPLEADMRARYADYDAYAARVSSFFPRPPKCVP